MMNFYACLANDLAILFFFFLSIGHSGLSLQPLHLSILLGERTTDLGQTIYLKLEYFITALVPLLTA